MRDPFVAQLSDLCRRFPTRAKWVFVPSHGVGHTLGDRLARMGTSWANLRVVTPLDIALRMAAPFLVDRGIMPSEDSLGPALIMRLLLDLPADEGYFRPLAQHPSMAEALWTTLRELRMTGLRAVALDALGAAGGTARLDRNERRKHDELVALMTAYEHYLDANGVADMPIVYEEAPRHLQFCPIGADDLRTELPGTIWAALQRRLIDALPGEVVVPQSVRCPGLIVPRRAATLAAPSLFVDASCTSDAERLKYLVRPSDAPPPVRDGTIDLFRAGGREAEVDEVFRRIFRAGLPLDQVEIACPSDEVVTLVWEKACRYEWPVTIAAGVSAALTRPGRAVLGFCAWIESGFSAGVLRRLLQSGDVLLGGLTAAGRGLAGGPLAVRGESPASTETRDAPGSQGATTEHIGPYVREEQRSEAAGSPTRVSQRVGVQEGCSAGRMPAEFHHGLLDLTAGQAARLLLAAEAGWGRATYRFSLRRLARRYRRYADDPDAPAARREDARDKAEKTERLLEWVEAWLAALPDAEGRPTVALMDVIAAASAFLERTAARMNVLDAAAHVALTDRLLELRSLGPFACALPTALRFIRGCVDGVAIGRDRARPGHLHVSTPTTAGLDGRPLVFLMGLEEGRVFPPSMEDPVLLDAERSRIDPRLRQSADRLDEAVNACVSRMATGGARVVFSYSCRDVREYRETLPSWIVLQAFRVKEGDPDAGYDALDRALGLPVSAVPARPDDAPGDAAWWLAHVKNAAQLDAVLAAFPRVAAGREAERQRDAPVFGAFDGYVPAAGPLLDPTITRQPVSATMLEDAAACPFRHFLKQGLRVDAIDDRARDADVWLDHLTRGAELHALYATILRERRPSTSLRAGPSTSLRTGSGTLDRDAARARARALGSERLAALRIEMPPPSDEVFDRESKELLRDLDVFIAAEAEALDGVGVAFEVSFGLPIEDEADREPLARVDPVEIRLGRDRFLLRGRIDRINRTGPSTFEIVDYKTGRFWEDKWKGVFAGGTRLQHALYRLAATRLLEGWSTGAEAGCSTGTEAGATAAGGRPLVSRGVYYFTSVRGRQQLVPISDDQASALPEVLADLFNVIRGGTFLHASEEDTCRYCDFGAACGPRPVSRAAAKLKSDPGALASVLRLAAHD